MSIDDIKLPKSGLRSLSVEQVKQVIREYKKGSKLSANLVLSAFGEYAHSFISMNNEDKWEDFCKENINSHFHQLIDDELAEAEQEVSQEIMHYPLFARRRIVEIIKENNYELFLRLVLKHPLSYFSCAQLWDPNTEVNVSVKTYYNFLAEYFLLSGNINAKSYLNFIDSVTSPYKNFIDISQYYEADSRSNKFKAIFIQQLLASRMGVLLRLRPEQLEGMHEQEFFMPAPMNLSTIAAFTNRWIAEQASEFKTNLAGVLLQYILEIDKNAYSFLVKDLGNKLPKIQQEIISPEFPTFFSSELIYNKISRISQDETKDYKNLLASSILEFSYKKQNLNYDLQRVSRSIRYLQGRKFFKPWELRTINSDIRKLQKEYYEIDMKLEDVEDKLAFLGSRGAKIIKPQYSDILKQIDAKSIEFSFDNKIFKDPLMFEEVFSFSNKNKEAAVIKLALEEDGFLQTKEDYPEQAELIDYLHIWAEVNSGKSFRKLKKKYKDYRVNRVAVEYLRKVDKKTLKEIKKAEPKLSKMASLVESREQLDNKLLDLAQIVVNFTSEVCNAETKNLEEFIDYSNVVAIIWDWLTLQIENPYVSGSEKINRFRPWFDRELSLFIKEKDFKVYQALCYVRPEAVLGLTPGADFNWKDTPIFQQYIKVITELFLETGSGSIEKFEDFKRNISSPFNAFLDNRKYDLDSASNKILLLDNSQKHLFNSQYRQDAMKLWADFHNKAFLGDSSFNGLFFELIMKELKSQHKNEHLNFCVQLLEIERLEVSKLREQVYINIDSSSELEGGASRALESFEELNNRLGFLEEIKRGLWT